MFTSRAEFGTFNAAAVRESRLVTIRPFLLFATERGDAWILDPVDHLASPIAETGVPRTVHIVETENASRSAGEAVKRIVGPAFVFRDEESAERQRFWVYPTRQISARIAEVFG